MTTWDDLAPGAYRVQLTFARRLRRLMEESDDLELPGVEVHLAPGDAAVCELDVPASALAWLAMRA